MEMVEMVVKKAGADMEEVKTNIKVPVENFSLQFSENLTMDTKVLPVSVVKAVTMPGSSNLIHIVPEINIE